MNNQEKINSKIGIIYKFEIGFLFKIYFCDNK